ncbi:MAG: YbhB/YbcL family Raf kinase inhibitor-like protein [archaeon]
MGGRLIIFLIVVLLITGCVQEKAEQTETAEPATALAGKEVVRMPGLKISSPEFANNGNIPSKYACDGDGVSPPLEITGVPEGAKSLVLMVDDPDAPAGTWGHWIVWDIPASTSAIGEGTAPGTEGLNDFKKTSYGGPCPPSGTHRYFFRLYALDIGLGLPPAAKKNEVEAAMQGHIIAQAELVGLYHRG